MSMNTNTFEMVETTTPEIIVTTDDRNFFVRLKDDHPFECGVGVGAAAAIPVTYFITKAATEKKINKDWESKFEAYKKDCRNQVYAEIKDEAARLKNK